MIIPNELSSKMMKLSAKIMKKTHGPDIMWIILKTFHVASFMNYYWKWTWNFLEKEPLISVRIEK